MDAEVLINKRINEIILEIQNKYPELSKYFTEMPISIPNEKDPEVTLKKLQDYLNSLVELLDHYSITHKAK